MDTIKQALQLIKRATMSEVNEGEFYIFQGTKRRVWREDKESEYGGTFTDQIQDAKSFKTQKSAQSYLESTLDAKYVKEERISVKNESEFCAYGYVVDAKEKTVTPIYTSSTLINRATNWTYFSNIQDAMECLDDLPNRQAKMAAKRFDNKVSVLAKQAESMGMSLEQLINLLKATGKLKS